MSVEDNWPEWIDNETATLEQIGYNELVETVGGFLKRKRTIGDLRKLYKTIRENNNNRRRNIMPMPTKELYKKTKSTSITLPPAVAEKINQRRGDDMSVSGQILEDISMLWAVCDLGLKSAKTKLTKSQAMLILDVQNATFFDSSQVGLWIIQGLPFSSGLAHQVSDGITLDGLDKKWEVDKEETTIAVNELSQIEVLGLLDWTKHFWRSKNLGTKGFMEKAVEGFRD